MSIHRATLADLDALAPLLDAYRVFYGQESDVEAARRFLQARLERDESVVFLAMLDDQPAGFTQLYPLFSSVALRPIWLLNDLYVSPQARRRGVGRALLEAARGFGTQAGAARLWLQTARENTAAQATYTAQGWQPDDAFLSYTLPLSGPLPVD